MSLLAVLSRLVYHKMKKDSRNMPCTRMAGLKGKTLSIAMASSPDSSITPTTTILATTALASLWLQEVVLPPKPTAIFDQDERHKTRDS
jgi:hypothetical protein